jgi:hypothetical protein
MDINRYSEILEIQPEYNKVKIVSHIPEPIDLDYKRGYIVRYFLQKSNDTNGLIFEIKKSSVDKFSDNPFYTIVGLDWRITGSTADIKKSNGASVRIASETIPKLALYLPNLLQFHKK